MNSIILDVQGLSKHFDQGKTPAIEDVSMTLERGKVYALVGPSGCGKTTLMHCIGHLESYEGGTVAYAGTPMKAVRSWSAFRREFLGFVFQFHHLLPTLTLRENVELVLQFSKTFPGARRYERVKELLKMVGLEHKANAFAENVSGGERQRTAIARAFANAPELILADEPTGNVDSHTSTMILDYMKNYVKSENKTILLATHDPDAEAIADEIIFMKDGKIA